MATKKVVCPECKSPLSPGRFACSSCGALVASVATVARRFMAAEPILPPVLAPAISHEPSPPHTTPAPVAVHERVPPRPARIVAPNRRAASPFLVVNPSSMDRIAPQPPPRPDEGPRAPLAWVLDASEPALASSSPPVPAWPNHGVWPPTRPVQVAVPPAEQPAARIPAGAYLPPSAILPPGEAMPIALPARANEATEMGGHPEPDEAVSTSVRLRLGEGVSQLRLPVDAHTRVVVLGAGLAALGFLLPWAHIVIGSSRIGGYLEQWGLAGPGHGLVLAFIVGLAVLGLVAERLPRWVRLGLPSIGLAFLLTGLVWPYLVGPFDASIGVYVVAVGALVMIAGGLLERAAPRHVTAATTV